MVKKKAKHEHTKKKSDDKFIENLDIYTCDVSSDNKFFCANGDSFKNVIDLGNSLDSMDEKTFGAHVNSEKNDFATWIYDVVGDVALADTLRDLDNLEDTKREVKVRIEFLEGN